MNMYIFEPIGIILATVLGIISLVLSIRNDRKLASKEHELKENVYSDILRYMAILSSIKSKISRGLGLNEVQQEIELLNESISTPGFLVLRSNFKKNDDIRVFDDFIKILSTGDNNREEILALTISLQQLLCDKIDLNSIKVDISKIKKDICEYEKNITNIYSPKPPERFVEFVKHLYDSGIKDADVALFHGVFENNVNIVKNALNDGANRSCTDKMIIERYENEYKEFIKSKN